MSHSARVQSIDAIKAFRAQLIRFADGARAALGDSDAEILRAGTWLRQDREPFWKAELQRRSEIMQRAKSALNAKRLYKSAAGARQSSIEEEKAYALARRRFEEAEYKVERIQFWKRHLEDERFIYKAQSQRMARAVDIDVPRAVATLDRILDRLDDYLSLTPDDQTALTRAAESMSRGDATARREAEQLRDRRLAEIAAIRANALTPAERDETPPRDEAPAFPDAPPIGAAQWDAVDRLDWPRRPVQSDDVILVAARVGTESRLAWVRVVTSTPGDSGWQVAPVERAAGDDRFVAVPAAALLRARPDCERLLTLPLDSIVVESGGVIEYLCEPTGNPIELAVDDENEASGGTVE